MEYSYIKNKSLNKYKYISTNVSSSVYKHHNLYRFTKRPDNYPYFKKSKTNLQYINDKKCNKLENAQSSSQINNKYKKINRLFNQTNINDVNPLVKHNIRQKILKKYKITYISQASLISPLIIKNIPNKIWQNKYQNNRKRTLPYKLHSYNQYKYAANITSYKFSTPTIPLKITKSIIKKSKYYLNNQKKIHGKYKLCYKPKIVISNNQKYCLYYNRYGKCTKLPNCPFIHDSTKITICTRFLKGNCNIERCLFSHRISAEKMPVCKYFLQGTCNKTSSVCIYSHVKVNPDAKICLSFVKGMCKLGDKCSMKHVLECSEFNTTGQCKNKTCSFKHAFKRRKNNKNNAQFRTKGSKPWVKLLDIMNRNQTIIMDPDNYKTRAQSLSDRIRKLRKDLSAHTSSEHTSNAKNNIPRDKKTLGVQKFPHLPSIIRLAAEIENDSTEDNAIFEKYENIDVFPSFLFSQSQTYSGT